MSENKLLDMEDERRLQFTLTLRENMIKELVKDGLPKSEEELSTLTSLLDGMDRTVLGKARVKASEKANENNEQIAGMVASLLAKVPFNGEAVETIEPPSLPEDVQPENVVPGETSIGVEDIGYDEFMKKMKKES